MTKQFKKEQHALYSMNYNLTLATNHGSKIFNKNEYVDSLQNTINNINKTFEVKEINLECGQNYIILNFNGKPGLKIPLYIGTIKSITSREIRKKFPILSLLRDKIWAPNYFITTSGNTTMKDRQAYIDSQSQTKDSKNKEVLKHKHERFRSNNIA